MTSFYLPDNLDIKACFPSWSKSKIQRAKWLLSSIVIKTEDKDVTPLYSPILSEYLTTRHYDVIDRLEEAGIIRVSKEYSTASHRSKEYGLTNDFLGRGIKAEPIESKAILKRLEEHNEEDRRITEKNMTASDRHVIDCLKRTDLLQNSALEFAEQNYTGLKLTRAKGYMRQFETREFTYSKPYTGGRLYYVMTSIPKELRRFVIFNYSYLWEADLKSFWPSCVVSLAKFEERKRLEQLIGSGQFYEYVAQLIEKPTSRDDVKKMFMSHVLFSDNRIMPPLKRRFGDAFPWTMMKLRIMKKDGAGHLENYFSRKEAEIVFPIVSELPFGLTVHDSIVASRDRIQWVQQSLEERASRILDLPIKSEMKLLGGRVMPREVL